MLFIYRVEKPKSSQWLDFQAMADRISTTVQKTSTSIKKITDTTNVTKLVGGVIKEQVPQGSEGECSLLNVIPFGVLLSIRRPAASPRCCLLARPVHCCCVVVDAALSKNTP